MLPPGPRRLTDDGELDRFHVAPAPWPRRWPRGAINLGAARRILVVRLDFVGDWILTTPFLEELRRRAPTAHITAVVIDRAFAFADADRTVNRVVSMTSARGRRITVGASSVADVAGFVSDYERRRFDLALVPRWDVDFNGATLIAWGSGAPRVAGFSEVSTAAKASANRGDDRYATDVLIDRSVRHETERMLTLFRILGGGAVAEHPVHAATTIADEIAADALFTGAFRRPVLAVAPFVDQGRRTFPSDVLAGMVDRLAARFRMDVAVVAAPVHTLQAEAFATAISGPAVSLAGRLTLRQTAAVMRRCAAAIAMDSGPAHIAAGVGLPVAVLSCHPADGDPGHPQSPLRFAPRTPPGRSLVLQPRTALPPCSDGCRQDDAHCITQLARPDTERRLSEFLAEAIGHAGAVETPGGATGPPSTTDESANGLQP